MRANGTLRWLALAALAAGLILVPYALWGQAFEDWAAALARGAASRRAWSAGLLVALLAADIALPVPSSLVSTALGALLGAAGGALASWAGLMAGSLIGFGLGRLGGRPLARRFVGDEALRRLEGLRARWADWAVVAARPVPVLAEASVLFAGLSGMQPGRFCALAGAANLGVSAAYAAAGAWACTRGSFLAAFAAAVALPGAALLLARRRRGGRPAAGPRA